MTTGLGDNRMTSAEYLDWIGDLSYLELGVGNGKNFERVKCKDKMSVDINGNGMFNGTTDQFFDLVYRDWDVIFIDADHNYNQVLKDFRNALNVVDKWIIIHDLVPRNQEYCSPNWNGDGYLLLDYIIEHTNIKFYITEEENGMTFIYPHPVPDMDSRLIDDYWVPYKEFKAKVDRLKRYSPEEIENEHRRIYCSNES